MLEFRYDTQLLIEGENLSEDDINDYITDNLKGDCLLAVGDEELIKIHFHTNEPWKLLEYCASLGEIYDIVVEDMERQANGLQGQNGVPEKRRIVFSGALFLFIDTYTIIPYMVPKFLSQGWL